jgi:hypothetical protein
VQIGIAPWHVITVSELFCVVRRGPEGSGHAEGLTKQEAMDAFVSRVRQTHPEARVTPQHLGNVLARAGVTCDVSPSGQCVCGQPVVADVGRQCGCILGTAGRQFCAMVRRRGDNNSLYNVFDDNGRQQHELVLICREWRPADGSNASSVVSLPMQSTQSALRPLPTVVSFFESVRHVLEATIRGTSEYGTMVVRQHENTRRQCSGIISLLQMGVALQGQQSAYLRQGASLIAYAKCVKKEADKRVLAANRQLCQLREGIQSLVHDQRRAIDMVKKIQTERQQYYFQFYFRHDRERKSWEQREAELKTRLEEMEKDHTAALADREVQEREMVQARETQALAEKKTELDHERERKSWEQREAELKTRLEEMEKDHRAAPAGKEMDQMAGEMSGMSQVFEAHDDSASTTTAIIEAMRELKRSALQDSYTQLVSDIKRLCIGLPTGSQVDTVAVQGVLEKAQFDLVSLSELFV